METWQTILADPKRYTLGRENSAAELKLTAETRALLSSSPGSAFIGRITVGENGVTFYTKKSDAGIAHIRFASMDEMAAFGMMVGAVASLLAEQKR